MKVFFTATLLLALAVKSCGPAEQKAYQLEVTSGAFLRSMMKQHTECPTAKSDLCGKLAQAVSAQHALADAIDVYCAGPDYNAGGKCNAPAKGTPAYTQALAKMQAAITLYEQAETDLKGATH